MGNDNSKIIFGTTSDVEIYYDNTQLVIDDTTTQLINCQDNVLTTTGAITGALGTFDGMVVTE